jgi:predicted secreted protein
MYTTRRITLVLILALSLASLALYGCGSGEDKEVTLTEADNGTSVTLKKGQVLAITLPARPTRGERWDPSDLSVYKELPMGRDQFRPDSNIEHYDGYQILRFEAKTRGSYDLHLVYRVVGAEDKPLATFEVSLTIE